MKKQLFTLLSAALLGAMVQPAYSAVIVSNLDPAEFFPSGPVSSAPEIGQAVMLGDTAINLTSVVIPQPSNQISSEELAVFSRNANGTVGTMLFNDFTLRYDGMANLTYAPAGSGFTLQADTGYFFVLESTTGGSVTWNYTQNSSYSSAYGASLPATNTSFTSDGTTTTYANLSGSSTGPQLIDVNGSAVPEPSSVALVGMALVGGAVALKRRRKAA